MTYRTLGLPGKTQSEELLCRRLDALSDDLVDAYDTTEDTEILDGIVRLLSRYVLEMALFDAAHSAQILYHLANAVHSIDRIRLAVIGK